MLYSLVGVPYCTHISAQLEDEIQLSSRLLLLLLASTYRKLECVKLVATDVDDKWMTPGLHHKIIF